MRVIRSGIGLLISFLPLLVAPQASATGYCIVQKSADGFVALRAAPAPDGQLLVRAKAGEAVVILTNASGDQFSSGPWLRVLHFADTIAPPKTDPEYKRGRAGWMHKRYIDECG